MILQKKYPKILTHKNIFNSFEVFGTHDFVVTKNYSAYRNKCPHRGNKIITPSTGKSKIECGLHGFSWDALGNPLNNDCVLRSIDLECGVSGLLFKDWTEPQNSLWVNNLSKESFVYSHFTNKYGQGDWRWQMEMHVDILHVPSIHPLLSSYIDINKLKSERGEDWVCQYHEHGWWLFVYPFTHIEYEPGCLYFSEMVPNEDNKGYQVNIHYFFDKAISEETKLNFVKMAEVTFDEDIEAVNILSKNASYVEPIKINNHFEKDIKHFADWLKK